MSLKKNKKGLVFLIIILFLFQTFLSLSLNHFTFRDFKVFFKIFTLNFVLFKNIKNFF